jgi:hypothetical protein
MLRIHRSEQLQRKGKAELALVDPVDEDLDANAHALALQAAGQLLVGQALLLPEVLDDGLGARLVKLALWAAAGSIDTDLSFMSFLELYGTEIFKRP